MDDAILSEQQPQPFGHVEHALQSVAANVRTQLAALRVVVEEQLLERVHRGGSEPVAQQQPVILVAGQVIAQRRAEGAAEDAAAIDDGLLEGASAGEGVVDQDLLAEAVDGADRRRVELGQRLHQVVPRVVVDAPVRPLGHLHAAPVNQAFEGLPDAELELVGRTHGEGHDQDLVDGATAAEQQIDDHVLDGIGLSRARGGFDHDVPVFGDLLQEGGAFVVGQDLHGVELSEVGAVCLRNVLGNRTHARFGNTSSQAGPPLR